MVPIFAALCPRRPSARVSLVLLCEPAASLALCIVGTSFLPLTALQTFRAGGGQPSGPPPASVTFPPSPPSCSSPCPCQQELLGCWTTSNPQPRGGVLVSQGCCTAHPKGDPIPMSSHSPFPLPSPWQPLICFLSLWICLFQTFHIHRIIHVAFCVWLLSLGMFPRFTILFIACVSASFLFTANNPLGTVP